MKLINSLPPHAAFVVAFAAVVVTGVFEFEDRAGGLNLKEDNFNQVLSDNRLFVLFYVPWCDECKKLGSKFADLHEKYDYDVEDYKFAFAKVDCSAEEAVCQGQGITETDCPTVMYYRDGVKSGVKYTGGNDREKLAQFVEDHISQKMEATREVGEAAPRENGVYVLDEQSFKSHLEKGDTFVKFYAPWCSHCETMIPAWEQLARTIESDTSIDVTIAKIDCTKAQAICDSSGVEGYPALTYYGDGKKVESYNGGRNVDEMLDFVNTVYENRKAGDSPDKGDVLKLDVDTFKSAVDSDFTFVKFFAPWCGHCKRMAPAWDQLAETYAANDKVKIADVDCTSNDNKNRELCNDHGVQGFPTLALYSDGKKADEYTGKREFDDLHAFVDKALRGPRGEL